MYTNLRWENRNDLSVFDADYEEIKKVSRFVIDTNRYFKFARIIYRVVVWVEE